MYKLEKLISKAKESIRNERVALGLTQKEFADIAGIKFATYREFEQSGKISLQGFAKVLISLNKADGFEKFLASFEFANSRKRASKQADQSDNFLFEPIIKPSQKEIALDKQIFGEELFYSVPNGHIYEVEKLINIVLANYTDTRIALLIRYFGADRLRPYVQDKQDSKLLQIFNNHLKFLKRLDSATKNQRGA